MVVIRHIDRQIHTILVDTKYMFFSLKKEGYPWLKTENPNIAEVTLTHKIPVTFISSNTRRKRNEIKRRRKKKKVLS